MTNSALGVLNEIYVHSANVNNAMVMTIIGIYLHAVFVSFTLGFPLAILAWLITWYRTGDALFINYSKTLTMVWAVNFALGAVTGTIVEFGLLDIWPTSILLFSSSAFIPLLYEATIAFIGEAVLVVLFMVAIGRWRARYTLSVLITAWFLGSLSGYFIITANAWMNVPWGMGEIPHSLYPFLPTYGPDAANLTATLNLAALLLHYTVDGAGSLALTSVNFTSLVGTYFNNPWLPMINPDAIVTTLHTLLAAYAIGVGAVALAISIRYFRTHDDKYIKLLKPLLWILTIVLLVEPIVLGHFMGDDVVTYQPLKFTAFTALTGGSGIYGYEYYDPLEALFAYGNPYHPLYGFQYYMSQCRSLGNLTFGELYSKLDPGMLGYLGPLINVMLSQNCEAAVLSMEPLAPLVSAFYYTMIGAGILLAIASVLVLFTYLVRVPVLSTITDFINNEILSVLIGADNVMPFLASVMAVLSAIAATAGWAAREIGRQPWTVYGLITTNEVITGDAITPGFVAFVVAILLAIAIVGVLAMYYVATRPSLLDRIRGLVEVGGHE
ncbi:cytochrome bd ubiquinol oxidase, subunit I [Vulcanisaeta moutnovskia 768-28]|uniref:Cytochrome bd ubiquinol oxidase, subunit I n=1 Tax=Vulcanisaeta moutnovskia (strain 768-28) TaxID=985053 RepID=F0QTK2_VULM7|nr:cytochrome ubiquinol oxidase subunit I [Vulcanisaeta moutnovskia]ADY01715.1 cytochrome bd ubiquinol oxidase, subunit I [Vulcanisaeta moutnovskia 768-28]